MNINQPVTGLAKPTFDAHQHSETELIRVRAEIDKRLKLDINSLNLNEELTLQYQQAKLLYSKVATDNEIPTNQKAQVLNTIGNTLAQITKTIESVNSIDRLKKLEAATLAALQPLPQEAKQRFFDVFKDYLDGQSASAVL